MQIDSNTNKISIFVREMAYFGDDRYDNNDGAVLHVVVFDVFLVLLLLFLVMFFLAILVLAVIVLVVMMRVMMIVVMVVVVVMMMAMSLKVLAIPTGNATFSTVSLT